MATLKKIFSYSFGAADLKALIIKIVVYIVAGFVAGLVLGLLSKIPVLGVIFSIIGWIIDLYCLVGIVLTILDYLKILN